MSSDARELSRFKILAEAPEIRSMVECPVCYEVILPPITVCSGGHSVCTQCKTRLQYCPTCRGKFTTIRNLFAENFLNKCLLTCKSKDKGCNVVLPGKELSVHQNEMCEFRPLLCRQCFTHVPYDTYLAHLLTTEEIDFCSNNRCSAGFEITNYQHFGLREQNATFIHVWDPIWIHCYGNDFFCFLDQSSPKMEQLCWFIWVGAMGTAEVCKKFTCSITIWNKKAKGRKSELKYVGPVHPIRSQAQPDQVLQSGKCLIFLDQNLQNYSYDDGIDVVFSVHTKEDKHGQGSSTQSGEVKRADGKEEMQIYP